MGEVVKFQTDGLEPSDRLEIWGERIWKKLGGLETRTPDRQPFEGAVVAGQLGAATICRIQVGPHRIDRTPALIRRSDPELLKIAFQVRGQACLEQRDQRIVLNPGSWCVYEGSYPYTLQNAEAVEQIALIVPRQAFAAREAETRRALVEAFEVCGGTVQILRQLMMSTLGEMETVPLRACSDLGETLTDLARLAIQEKIDSRRQTSSEVMRERVKAYVRRNIADANMTVEALSSHFNCTARYLHKIFTDQETTLSRFIWNTRLERCSFDLGSADIGGRSITEIAFKWGFSNSAHFSRVFRKRFGTSPRQYRALHLHEAAS